ncbi:outer membrane protein assembly factor BamE [Thiomicrorhabdus sp. zzn3]|uniref:outer membrane protein assembly factor BamE n=1 Tax=Thiomicrorhabdus sp. zzn3 TaxID=3039775 RepID=UPI002436551B|nr:outer membrane protein assembly factor BamE [Thiomicrorhabdus sp. zzn3]MDG6778238.1 outer membrane protein assembly factor BamE [Thiomicrorhabdus sp. zzn3]
MKMIPTCNSATPFIQSLKQLGKSFKHPILAIGFSAAILSGCSWLEPYKATLTQGTIIPPESIELLQEGLTKDQARQLFGPPLGEDPFNPNHWDYAFYTTDDSFHPNAIKRLSITFDKDNMIKSWTISDKPIEIQRD